MKYLWRLQWGYLRALGRAAYERLAAEADGETPPWSELETSFFDEMHKILGGLPPDVVFPLDRAPPAPSADVESERQEPKTEPQMAPAARARAEPPLYVIVEKILNPEEPLPKEWPVAGTTGYDFLNFVGGLFVEREDLAEMVRIYGRFIGVRPDFREMVYQSKRLILSAAMSSDMALLAHRLNRLSEVYRGSRDFTLNSLRFALREILACFPVYRTYVGGGEVTERDRNVIQRAVAQAKRRHPAYDTALFDFVRDVLLLKQPPDLDARAQRERDLFIGRFQQVTSPVMAKGVEDTTFYRYYPLTSLNEVGGEPTGGNVGLDLFHRENLQRLADWPGSMLATTTHDTKRTEDVRARISVLAEIPHEWRKAVNQWARLNQWKRREVDGQPAPSRNDEYLFYQALVGVWPLEPMDAAAHQQLVQRLQAYMEKASREAKMHTSWVNPNAEYDEAVRQFVAGVLADHPKNRFPKEFAQFHQRVIHWGLYTALSQAFLKFTSPGVPDTYQGQELWDFSLVDPDNRRPVDFACRRELLARLHAAAHGGESVLRELAARLARTPGDPMLKLLVTWRTLQFRRRHARLFRQGRYQPLDVEGPRARHVCAFAWTFKSTDRSDQEIAVMIAPRLLAGLTPIPPGTSSSPPPLGEEVWSDTSVRLPSGPEQALSDCVTGHNCPQHDRRLLLADVLSEFPVGLLHGEHGGR